MSKFSIFIGIDQTGASRRGGRAAAPLKMSVLAPNSRGRFQLIPKILSAVSPRALGEHAVLDSRTLLAIDCVFGLPAACWKKKKNQAGALWELMKSTQGSPLYGRGPAEDFFQTLVRSPIESPKLPRRECELHCKANSVFLARPYQKNIQTGTYRIWKDLASESADRWFHLWPFEDEKVSRDLPWIFEGYPSHLWREIFNFKTRQPERIGEIFSLFKSEITVTSKDLALLQSNADFADSAILALGAFFHHREKTLFEPFPAFRKHPKARREGWILGVSTYNFL